MACTAARLPERMSSPGPMIGWPAARPFNRGGSRSKPLEGRIAGVAGDPAVGKPEQRFDQCLGRDRARRSDVETLGQGILARPDLQTNPRAGLVEAERADLLAPY